MNNENILLPCPFCGSKDIVFTKVSDDYEFVMCNGCGIRAVSLDTLPEKSAIEAWNLRNETKKAILA